MLYGERLNFALSGAGKTRKELASALGISVQAIGDVINGKTRAFTAENNARAAAFLSVSPSWLATGEGQRLPADAFDFFESSLKRLGVSVHRPGALMQHEAPDWLEVRLPDGRLVSYHPLFAINRADGTKCFVDFLDNASVQAGVADQLHALAASHPNDLILASMSDAMSSDFAGRVARLARPAQAAPAPYEAPSSIPGAPPDLVITEYDTGGAMGHGYALEENPPGHIKAWRVTPDWLRMNVPVYSSLANLCIVTGFGPSMKPRYNPGDPLLCDRGFNKVDSDGVYFFRVDGHGFIKQLQRIPTENGLILRAKSFNPDYDPFDITSKMDFEVFGKILTVWRSEQF